MDAPSPEHRPPPTYWTPPDAPWRPLGRWITWQMVVFGLAVSAVTAWGSIELVAAAWAACDEAEPPYLGALVVLSFPATTLVAWIAFGIAAVLTSRWHDIVRYATGAVLVAAVCLLAVANQVPAHAGYYAPSNDPSMAECGPNGIPTWWPSWLPS